MIRRTFIGLIAGLFCPLTSKPRFQWRNIHTDNPFRDHLEKSTLGSMMLDQRKVGEVLAIVDSRHFRKMEHSRIFLAIERLHQEGGPCHLYAVMGELAGAGMLKSVGGRERIVELLESTPNSDNARVYAESLVCFGTV